MFTRRKILSAAGALGGLSQFPQAAHAQIVGGSARILVGFPAGAGADNFARRLAERLRGTYASTLIVENRVGAGGRIAVNALKGAAPDGTTLLLTPASMMVLFPLIYNNLGYDPVNDFVPVGTLSSVRLGLVVGTQVPARNLTEYVTWAKQSRDRAVYASPGAGTMPHFLGSMVDIATGLGLQHVPYKGAAPARQDLLGGQIPAYMGIIGSDIIQDHRAGKIRILAVADPQRSTSLQEIPTFVEQGFKDVVAQEWLGLFLPAKTPSSVADALGTQVRAALRHEDLTSLVANYAMVPGGEDGAALGRRLKDERVLWSAAVKASGFTPES
jgi:tripartite-type tricarboxylate transporter receptor subunit TctC